MKRKFLKMMKTKRKLKEAKSKKVKLMLELRRENKLLNLTKTQRKMEIKAIPLVVVKAKS